MEQNIIIVTIIITMMMMMMMMITIITMKNININDDNKDNYCRKYCTVTYYG